MFSSAVRTRVFLILDTPTVVLIENEKLYEAYKNYFELLWNLAKP